MYKRILLSFFLPVFWADQSFALASSCPDVSSPGDYNWMTNLVSETYSYQHLRDNPEQNIAGDSIALDLRALAVLDDGTVKDGDQIQFKLTNGAKFANNPGFAQAPPFTLELDLGGAGTGNLTVATLMESDPVGGDTLTFDLVPANFPSPPYFDGTFSAPPVPCDPHGFYYSEGVILSGAHIAGQASYYTFADEPWAEQEVTLQTSYLRGGSKLFGGERVLFVASDWVADVFPDDPIETQDSDGDGIGDHGDAGGVGKGIRVKAADTLNSCGFSGPVTNTSYGELTAPGQVVGDQLSFTLTGCGDSVTVEALFGDPLPKGAVAFKVNADGEWLRIPDAVIEGNKITYTITDDGVLDDNKTAGVIVDPVTAVVLPVSVPVLPFFGLLSLGGAVLLAGLRRLQNKRM